jgi:3-hydroxyisobutyrate dehydrogenase/2-hydroxy-3-oxopropionate reductase
MLADGAAAIAVYEGPDGLLASIGSESVVVDMSTIGPDLTQGLASQVSATGATMLDAPVSGSVPAARAGTLVAMVGGDAGALARVDGVLDAMTAQRIHVGPSGAGAAMKLALNGALAVFNAALSEALVLAERAGIERETAWDVFAASAIGAPFVSYKRDAFLGEPGGDVAFTTAGMRKDVNLAIALGQQLGVPLHTAGAANALLTMATAAGHGDSDFASVSHVIRDLAEPGDTRRD